MEKTDKRVYVRNQRKRVYNGIRHMQIAEISAENLDQYLLAGFLEFDPKTGKDIVPVEDDADADPTDDGQTGVSIDDYTVKDLKAYLDDHNIEYKKSANKDELFAKAVANGLGAGSAEDVDDTGLGALDEDDEDEDDGDLSVLDEDGEDDEDEDDADQK